MSEIKYQAKVRTALQEAGYYVIRLTATDKNGISDLLALKPNEPAWFIEIKAKGGKMSPLQEYRRDEQTGQGFKHTVTYDGDDFLAQLLPHKQK